MKTTAVSERDQLVKEVRAAFERKPRINMPTFPIGMDFSDRVVLLDDRVTGLTQKRLAGVLAWWVPGSRDVINGTEVVPDQLDSDEEMAKTVRAVLKKDPVVNEGRSRVTVQRSIVTLTGDVPSAPQRDVAEFDA